METVRNMIGPWNPGCGTRLIHMVKGGSTMAYPRNPNDPYRSDLANDEFRNAASDSRSAASLDSELQPDAELAEGPASGSRVALFAVAIAIVLGAVFYGLNNTSVAPNGST